MQFFSNDLGVDLGTSNVLIYADGKGLVVREPAVVALDRNSGKILQVGAAARNMLNRTPGNVVAMRPLREGVISDHADASGNVQDRHEGIHLYAQTPCGHQCSQWRYRGGGAQRH